MGRVVRRFEPVSTLVDVGRVQPKHRFGASRRGGQGTLFRRFGALDGDPLDLIFGVSWSPDDRSLLVDRSDLYIKDRRLLTIDSDTGQCTLLLRERDPKNVTAEWWSDWGS